MLRTNIGPRKTTLVMHSKEEFCQLTGFLALTRGGRPVEIILMIISIRDFKCQQDNNQIVNDRTYLDNKKALFYRQLITGYL